jgi:DNA topoisomerase IA
MKPNQQTYNKLVIAEKPSVAQSIAAVLGAINREDGYLTDDMKGTVEALTALLADFVPFAKGESTTKSNLAHFTNSGKVSDHHATIST